MERITSFTVNHLNLQPGLYVSRRDEKNHTPVTTFDLRMTAPNKEPVMDVPAVHTIEHLGATYLRNRPDSEDVIYFGPMGCRTGFYLVLFGDLESADVYGRILDLCRFILDFEGDIPGAAPEECGNYSDQNLNMARYYIRRYYEALKDHPCFVYPD